MNILKNYFLFIVVFCVFFAWHGEGIADCAKPASAKKGILATTPCGSVTQLEKVEISGNANKAPTPVTLPPVTVTRTLLTDTPDFFYNSFSGYSGGSGGNFSIGSSNSAANNIAAAPSDQSTTPVCSRSCKIPFK